MNNNVSEGNEDCKEEEEEEEEEQKQHQDINKEKLLEEVIQKTQTEQCQETSSVNTTLHEPHTQTTSTSSSSSSSAHDRFACKICLELADEPVITPCGHLYCWKCLYKWSLVKPCCPFCNNRLEIKNLISIYTEGQPDAKQSQQTAQDETQQQQQSSDSSIPRRPTNNQRATYRDASSNSASNSGGDEDNSGNARHRGQGGQFRWRRFIGLIPMGLFIIVSMIHQQTNESQEINQGEQEEEYNIGQPQHQPNDSTPEWTSVESYELLAIILLLIAIIILQKFRTA